MKKSNILWFLMILLISTSCEKDESGNSKDVIVFKEINKTVVDTGIDSITGTCKDLRFELFLNDQSENLAMLTTNTGLINCDGFNSIMADTVSAKVLVLDEQMPISAEASWAGVHDLSLEDFAGLGEKYIGYRSCFYPEGVNQYRFGWINIKLSSTKDTLTIISRADNQTINKYIIAGKME